MDRTRALVYGTVALLAAVTLASGPLVGAVDLTQEEEEFNPGTGTATVTVVDIPEEAVIVRGQHGAGNHYLRLGAATVDVVAVEQQPLLVYKLRIPDLGYARSTIYFLDSTMTGRQRIELDQGAVDSDSLTRDSYSGELTITVRSEGTDRTVHRGNVTVRVRR